MKRTSKSGGRRSKTTDQRRRSSSTDDPNQLKKLKPSKLRIIGGSMRGRAVTYHGAEFTRPMRDSVRENLFNILGGAPRGAVAIDLFAGTGVLAFEAISRGAVRAIAVEPARRAIKQIRQSAEHLGIGERLTLISGDAFVLADKLLRPASDSDDTPWIVFLSPPYRMWHDEIDFGRLCRIIGLVKQRAPLGSVLVVETDDRFDPASLPTGDWDVRTYGITRLCFLEPATVCGWTPMDDAEPSV